MKAYIGPETCHTLDTNCDTRKSADFIGICCCSFSTMTAHCQVFISALLTIASMGSTRHTTQCCADFAGILAAGGLPRCDFDASLLPAEAWLMISTVLLWLWNQPFLQTVFCTSPIQSQIIFSDSTWKCTAPILCPWWRCLLTFPGTIPDGQGWELQTESTSLVKGKGSRWSQAWPKMVR